MQVEEEKITKEAIEMIEKFQCPGCTCGHKTDDCEEFYFTSCETGCWCLGHSAGFFMAGAGKIALGLPRGFCRVGTIKTSFEDDKEMNSRRRTNIRLILDHSKIGYDKFNIPVWAMEEDGYLFTRVICPRINYTYVDVIKGGKIKDICPNAVDVGEFIDEID